MVSHATEAERQAAQGYEELFVPALFGAWVPHVLKAAGVSRGAVVLDVACGTGVLARNARDIVGRSGRVTGLDPAAGMLAVAQELQPGITWIQATAEDTGLPADSFDSVATQFGLMFFQDRAAALGEVFRVLHPGGHLGLAVWDTLDRNPVYARVAMLLDDMVGPEAGNAVRVPFALGDSQGVIAELAATGLSDISVETPTEQARFPSIRSLVEAELRGWLPLFHIHLDEPSIERVLTAAEDQLADVAEPSGEAVFPTSAHVFSARRPG